MIGKVPSPARIRHPLLRALVRKDVLAGVMFMAIAGLGLWLSRDYPVGTAVRMGTGYMPRLLCWTLMALGAIVLVQGLIAGDGRVGAGDETEGGADEAADSYWPVALVAASLVAFGLSIERLGLIAAVALLVVIGGLAYRGLRWWETLAAALVLAALSWVVFSLGLGLAIPVWPEF